VARTGQCRNKRHNTLFSVVHVAVTVNQRGPAGGPRATSGQRPLVIRPAKLFVNLLLVTTSSFIFFTPKDLKKKLIPIASAAKKNRFRNA
jgi:hypothetical protein